MIALITGASSGIGRATAKIFAEKGMDLIITGRRRDKLEELKTAICSKGTNIIHIMEFDVRDKKSVKEVFSKLPTEFSNIDILINNAGNAHGRDFIQDGSLEDWDSMIDINVKGLLYVSREVIPLMVKQKSGIIINLSSIAGKEVYPQGNVYCASKHAVEALTLGMRMDLNQYGIKVGSVAPGMVDTEFSLVRFKGDKVKADAIYKGFDPLMAEDIAETIYFMVSRPKHVNIADVLILPTAQASGVIVNRVS